VYIDNCYTDPVLTRAVNADPDSDPAPDRSRHERVTVHRTPPGGNSLAFWTTARHPLRVAINYALIWVVRVSPSLALKRLILRLLGADVAQGVAWGLEATPDVFWPDHVALGEDAVIGYDATLLCHEFLQDEYRVGADAQVAANSLVTEDVPPGETVAGVPAIPMSTDAIRSGGRPE
jgi:hypothetical protein